MSKLIEKLITLVKKNSYLYIGRRWFISKKNEILYPTLEKQENYIKKKFKKQLGYEIDFEKEPETFNQKIQFRKLYDKNLLYSICADKYGAREYIKSKVGEEYLVPIYLVTEHLTEEQWEKLPNSFVVKPTHDNGTFKVVKNKNLVNKNKVIKYMDMALKLDYGKFSWERFYSSIPRKIIVEKYLADDIKDYRFHCFMNKERKIFVEISSTEKRASTFYEASSWKNLKFGNWKNILIEKQEKPQNYDKMLEIAKKLSEDFDYVRVDLYNVDGKVYVGELTFCDNGGFGKFTDEKWDYKFGSYWNQKKLK